MQSEVRLVEAGQMGRVAYARVAPNEDLVLSIEKLCAAEGFRHAFVRGGHIVVDRSVVGTTPTSVLATSLDGIELRITQDAETHMPLMRPFAAAAGMEETNHAI